MLTIEYIAGFFDGEGSVTINIQRVISKSGTISYRFNPHVNITNTNKEILEEIQKYFGKGNIVKRAKYSSKHKDTYALQFRINEMVEVLDRLSPFLVLKKIQAEKTSLFIKEYKGQQGDNSTLTLEEIKRRLEIATLVQGLNKRGPDEQ